MRVRIFYTDTMLHIHIICVKIKIPKNTNFDARMREKNVNEITILYCGSIYIFFGNNGKCVNVD